MMMLLLVGCCLLMLLLHNIGFPRSLIRGFKL